MISLPTQEYHNVCWIKDYLGDAYFIVTKYPNRRVNVLQQSWYITNSP